MAKRGRPKKSAYPPASKKTPEKSEAKKWTERIKSALKVKEEWKSNFRVNICYEYFEGRHRPSHIPESEWITINLIYSTLRAELPALYSTDPYYYVKVKKSFSPKPEDVALYETRSKIRQAMLNYLKGELDLKPKSRMSIFDAMFQFGVTKTLFRADRVENPEKGKPVLAEDGRPHGDRPEATPRRPRVLRRLGDGRARGRRGAHLPARGARRVRRGARSRERRRTARPRAAREARGRHRGRPATRRRGGAHRRRDLLDASRGLTVPATPAPDRAAWRALVERFAREHPSSVLYDAAAGTLLDVASGKALALAWPRVAQVEERLDASTRRPYVAVRLNGGVWKGRLVVGIPGWNQHNKGTSLIFTRSGKS